ncbi:MAG: hypothetical protein R3B36_04715 [Polyangiaceae bacterium]
MYLRARALHFVRCVDDGVTCMMHVGRMHRRPGASSAPQERT